jgi:uncharacterized membrane protein
MSPLYKEALCWLILLAVTAAAYAILAVFLGPVAATGAFGFLGLGGFFPLLYRKRGQAVVLDERDQQIAYRALVAGYSIFWLAFTLGIVGLWAVLFYGGQSMVSVHVLPNIVWGGMIVFMTARAVAIIVQYRLQDAAKGG